MGLTGTLKDGTRIDRIPGCEFVVPGLGPAGQLRGCEETALYRVVVHTGEVLHACEEHAQLLWDVQAALDQESHKCVSPISPS